MLHTSQFHSQAHRHLTSAHLAQTMTLLSLTATELYQQIENELAANPALELVEERRCPTCHRLLPARGACPVCSKPQPGAAEEPIVFISTREDFFQSGGTPPEDLPEDNFSTEVEDLPSFVLRQVASELAPQDRQVAAYLLTHLDEDGFLTITPMEVARYFHIAPDRVRSLIAKIKRCEPIGVGSTNAQEALLVQLEVLAETIPVPPLAQQIVLEGMELLSRHQYPELAHLLKTSSQQVRTAARFITENLNPFPARAHWGDQRQPVETPRNVYNHPDIIISYLNGKPENQLVVEIIMPLGGTLRVNPLFRQALHQATEEKMDAWRNDLDRANLLVKCIQQRNHTMRRLMQSLVRLQSNFICNGEENLIPLTRAQISKELEVHESTISRAVSNKAIQLPNGRIVPLDMFFDRSLNIRSVLKNIINAESTPFSDAELSTLLAKYGFSVARRTVAKYRAMEGILPAHLRHTSPTAHS